MLHFLCLVASAPENVRVSLVTNSTIALHWLQNDTAVWDKLLYTAISFFSVVCPGECDSVPGDQQHHCSPLASGRHFCLG
jgi:hypothetical protein